ncbi:MAG: glycosyltransferase family 2 protein [bacterium]
MSPLPHVHILLINFNGWRDTVECLDSVFALNYPDFSVIVCDCASADDSLDQLATWRRDDPAICRAVIDETDIGQAQQSGTNVTVIRLAANRGFTGGNNAGLRHLLETNAEGLVWILNNDTIIAPESLREMVRCAEEDRTVGAVGATLLEYKDREMIQAAAGGTISRWTGMAHAAFPGAPRASARELRPRFNYICGGCLLIPLSVLRRVGLFDERFFIYTEDADLSLRIAAGGRKLAYCASAEVWHKGGATTVGGSPFHDFHNVRSALLFAHKYNRRGFPASLAYSVYRCVLPKVVRGQWRRLSSVFRAYRDVFSTLRDLRRVPERSVPPPAAPW